MLWHVSVLFRQARAWGGRWCQPGGGRVAQVNADMVMPHQAVDGAGQTLIPEFGLRQVRANPRTVTGEKIYVNYE